MGKQLPVKKSNGLPMAAMVTVVVVSFLDAFCNQLVVPNLPDAIKWFFPEMDEQDTGYYYGYMVSSYSFGGIVGNFFWGWYADSFGRKSSMLSCVTCQTILSVIFGLSQNFYSALVIRTLWGFMNGNLGVLKTYISEVCSADKQSTGFSILVTTGGIANVVGPMVGGFLGRPEESLPSLIRRFPWITQYRLLLPCLVGSLYCVIVIIIVAIFAPESLTKEMRKEMKTTRISSLNEYKSIQSVLRQNHEYVPTLHERYIIELNQGSYWALFKQRASKYSILIYGIYSVVQSGQDAIYPPWVTLSEENNGFSFNQQDLGWLFTGLAPIQIFSTPFLYPLLSKILTLKTISYITGFTYSALLLFGPLAGLTIHSGESIQWLVLIITYGLPQIFRFIFVTNSMCFITNSTFPDFRAKVNGLGQVMAALGRFIGPSLGSSIFSYCNKNGKMFPFHYGTPFYVLTLIMIGTTLLTLNLPDSINKIMPSIKKYYADLNLIEMEIASREMKEKGDVMNEGDDDRPIAPNMDSVTVSDGHATDRSNQRIAGMGDDVVELEMSECVSNPVMDGNTGESNVEDNSHTNTESNGVVIEGNDLNTDNSKE